VTPCRHPLVVVAFLFMSYGGWGQQTHRPRPVAPPAEGAPTAENTTELETFSRAVAIQATPLQAEFFQSAIESTDLALQESRELQRLGPTAMNIPNLNAWSLKLRDALDDVEHYNAIFLASFSKLQESELKKLTKKLRKSYPLVTKESKAVSQQLEPGKIVPVELKSAAANLEKALSDFRSDQIRLGREMAIQSK